MVCRVSSAGCVIAASGHQLGRHQLGQKAVEQRHARLARLGLALAELHFPLRRGLRLVGGGFLGLLGAFGIFHGFAHAQQFSNTSFGISLVAQDIAGLILATAIPFVTLSQGFIFILISRLLVSLKTRGNVLAVVFHPISMLVLVSLIIYSNYLKVFGKLTWKGRLLP